MEGEEEEEGKEEEEKEKRKVEEEKEKEKGEEKGEERGGEEGRGKGRRWRKKGRKGEGGSQTLKLALRFQLKCRFKPGSRHADVLYLTLNGNLVYDTSTIL